MVTNCRPPFLHWLLPSLSSTIFVFISFLFLYSTISSGLCHRVLFLTSFIWRYIMTHFSLKLLGHPSPHSFLQDQCFTQSVAGRDQACKPSSGSPPYWKFFNIRVISQDHPMWDFPSHNLSTQWKWTSKATLKKKEKKSYPPKRAAWGLEKIEIRTVSQPGSQLQCTGKSPFAQFSSCSHVVIHMPDPVLTHCTSYPLPLFQSWFGEE